MADQQLGAGGIERQMVVGISQVRPRREEHGDPVALAAPGRPDEERDVFLAVLAPQPHGVDAARHAFEHREAERPRPLEVVEIVVVEMDGAVLVRRRPEVVDLAPSSCDP